MTYISLTIFLIVFFTWISFILIIFYLFSVSSDFIFLGTKDLNYTCLTGRIFINHLWIQKCDRKNKFERHHIVWHMILEIITDFPYSDWISFTHSWTKGLKSVSFFLKLFGDLYPVILGKKWGNNLLIGKRTRHRVYSALFKSRFDKNFPVLLEPKRWDCLIAKQHYHCVYGDWQHSHV